MTVDLNTLDQYDGKRVILTTAAEGEDAIERTGKVEAASIAGLAFKEQGKRDVELVEPAHIIEIALAPEKPKKVTQKKLKEVTESNARTHLSDRHGWSRSELNEMSDEAAFKLHDELDHDDLGHKHVSEDDDEDENEDPEAEGTDED